MVDPGHSPLSITAQCRLLAISRSGWYAERQGESADTQQLLRIMDAQFLETPYYGSRQMTRWLHRQGYQIGRHRVRRLMRVLGIEAIYQKPRTSHPHPHHKVYPYLLKGLTIDRPNQVWCADITYVPLERSFLYPVAIMDWASRKVLAWRLSNTLDTAFCVEALEEALARHGRPEIFNTDQGAQFTAVEFTARLQAQQIAISMDGKGRWMDHVCIERLWRSLKYECVYLRAFATGLQAKQDIGHWMSHYNTDRPHSVFQGHTPDEIYYRLLDREGGPDRKGRTRPSAA